MRPWTGIDWDLIKLQLDFNQALLIIYVLVVLFQIPEFDNLYLDMNGIIHNCSHPNDEDIHLRIPEANIFRDIFYYIDFLFRMIKPRKVFFMAVDGVAPRAKMNQVNIDFNLI